MFRIIVILYSKYVLLFKSQSLDHTCLQIIVRDVTRGKVTNCVQLWTQLPQNQVFCNLKGGEAAALLLLLSLRLPRNSWTGWTCYQSRTSLLMLHLSLCLHLIFRLLGLRVHTNLLQVLLQVDRLRKRLQGTLEKVNSVYMMRPHFQAE